VLHLFIQPEATAPSRWPARLLKALSQLFPAYRTVREYFSIQQDAESPVWMNPFWDCLRLSTRTVLNRRPACLAISSTAFALPLVYGHWSALNTVTPASSFSSLSVRTGLARARISTDNDGWAQNLLQFLKTPYCSKRKNPCTESKD